MRTLLNSASAGLSHRLLQPVVYKLFSNLVIYGERYQAIEEVFLEFKYSDAVAIVKLKPIAGTGIFTCSPYWIDAIVHVAGFLLNGNPTKPNGIAYISTSFDSLRIIEELAPDKAYTSYVFTQPTGKRGCIQSDVYVFDGDSLVAVCAGIWFQMMTKTVFHAMIGTSPASPAPARWNQSQKMEQRTIFATDSRSSTKVSASDSSSLAHTQSASTLETSANESEESNIADKLLDLVVSETGYDVDEMEPSTLFSDMGVDLLMSIAITSTTKRRFGKELPASYFHDHPTVADVRADFGLSVSKVNLSRAQSEAPPAVKSTPVPAEAALIPKQNVASGAKGRNESPPSRNTTGCSILPPAKKASCYASNAVLMQGRASSTEMPLFLITDGAGSAAAYIHFPTLPGGRRVYALECPFLQEPAEHTCSMEEMGSLFLAAIKKLQSQGPYIIGGWSAGAAYAYEVASQLLAQNERIDRLFLIDMHIPTPMDNALEPAMQLIDETNRFRSNLPMNDRLKKQNLHLINTVKALIPYSPRPLDRSNLPGKTIIVWARHALGENDGSAVKFAPGEKMLDVDETFVGNTTADVKTRLKSWFFGKRTHLRPHGWDRLVGPLECHCVDGDHLSMVK